MPIKSYTDDDLWGDSSSAPQSQPASTARSIDDIWESPKKYAPPTPTPLSARTIDDIWGDAENVSDLGQLNNTTEDVAGPTGPVDAFSRSVSRAAESAFQGILGARVGMGRLPSMAALKAMSVYDPDKYEDITSSPDKMRQYQNSWEGIPVVGSINVDTTNEDMYRKWIAESKGKVETELRPSKKTLESESKGTWYRDLNWWAERSPEAVTQLAAAAATNILAPGAGLIEAGTVAGGSTFLNAEERLKSRGWSEPDAALTAVGEGAIMGVLEGVLEKVPLDLITKNKLVKGRILDTVAQKVAAAGPRFVGAGASEAAQEIASEVADMALQRVFEQDPTAFEGAGQRVAMAGALGAAAGGPMGIPATIGQVQRGRQLGELKAARPEIQAERTKAHMQEAEAMTNQLLQTEEGKKSLLELSQKPEPSRKDFEMAGYDTGRLRLNAEQRKQYAAELQQWVRPSEEQVQTSQAPEPTKVEGPVPPTTPAAEATAEAPPNPDTMQQVEEAVKETVKLTGGQGVGNEKAMFGPKGFFAKGFAAAKKTLGQTSGRALTPEAKQLMTGQGEKKQQREIKSAVGSSFEKFVSPAGSRKIVERAVDDVAEFMSKEGGNKFAEYYQQQSAEESQILRQRFPEMDPAAPAGDRMFQFYRMLNAIASAQTELSKNTEETMIAYDAVRQTGRVPVVFDEKGDPVYSMPKGKESRFEGPIYSDINSITDTVKELSKTIDQDAMKVLTKQSPVPEGLTQLTGPAKGKPVKTYKDYLYGYFAEKYIPSESKKFAFTTSKPLIAKLVREITTTPETDFKERVRTAFEIGGGSSQYNKAFNYQVLNDLMGRPEFQTVDASGRNTPNMPKIVEWLNERVAPDELNAEKEKLGYSKISPMAMRDIIDTVWTAEGQEEKIPRTFLFGPKVGAYMLNRMADADPRNTKYNTMDVWESRFWRYLNNDVPDTSAGIAEGMPRRVYMRQAREFANVWKEKMGTEMSVSAGQAARWYLMKEAAKKAGYGKAGENETIPHWTMQAIEKFMENQLGKEAGGDIGTTLAGVFGGEDLQGLNEAEQELREERAAIQKEKPGKATKAELAGPWTKPAKKAQKPSGQKELFPQEGPEVVAPEEATKTTVQDIGVTPETPELAAGITSVSFQEAAPQKPIRKISATTIARLPDAPSGQPDPNPAAHAIKNEYLKSVGTKPRRQSSYVKVNVEFAKRLADAYENLVSNPSDPEVKKAYEALAKETIAQWKAVKKSGIKIEFIKEGMEDPYKSGPREVHDDILNNNHLWVFPTTSGYGQGENLDSDNNPMLQKIGEVVDGHEMLVNDAFRIVHDYFGHSLEGASFGARGEENAWQAHVRMFSPLAARAMTTETRGQNSWVNYGPYGKKNREKQSETTFAEQKIGLLPEWASNENITPDVLERANDDTGRQEKKRDTKDTTPARDEGKAAAKTGEAKPTEATGGKPAARDTEGVPDKGVAVEAPSTEVAPGRTSTQSVVDYEEPATLDERESYFQQGRIDWKPNTGPQGTRTGKPKPKREVVRDVLERVGIVSESYDVHSRGPGILGFYRWALTRSHIFQTTGRELWLKASELANIGTAVHEAAHYLDQKFNLSGKVHQLTGAGVQPSPVGPGFLEGFSPAIQNSFRMLDYYVAQKGVLRPDPVSGLAEGWAEAVRLYVESADPSSVLGPDVKSTIDSLVMNNPEIAKILNATRSDVQAYLNSSDAEKVSMAMQDPSRALISPSESYFARQDRTGKSKGWYRLLAKKFQNRIRDLEEYEKQLKKTFLAHWSQGSAAMTGEQAWDQVLRDSGGLASQLLLNSQNMISRNTDHAILHYIQDPLDGTNMGPSGRSAFESFESQKELDDFGRYMYAKVAMNRWVQAAMEGKGYIVGETGQAVLQRIINEVESGPNAAKFAKASRDVTDYFNNLLELEVKYGLKTRGEVDAMKAKHDIYMPFFRQLEQRMSGTGGKVVGVKSGVRKLGGGSVMPVLDTYDAMIDRTNDLYSTVVRKAVETSFLKTAELSGVSGDFVRKLTAEEAESVKDVTKITTGGTTYYYKIDPDLKYALSQVNPQLSPMIADLLGIVGVPTGIAKKFMVTFNIPYFTTKNYVRDLKTSSIRGLQDITGIDTTGGIGLSPAAAKRVGADLPRALVGLGVKMTDIEMLFERQGGTKATVVKTTRSGRRRLGIATRVAEYVNPTIGEAITNLTADQTKRRVFLGAKDRSAFQAARDFMTKAAEWTESVNDSVELAARREAFMRTLQALGKTAGAGFSVSDDGSVTGDVPQWALSRAMYNGMEITTNFNRRGEWQPLIEPVFLFYNAAIQGTAGQIMTAKNAINSPIHRKRFAVAVALGAAAKILAMAVMYDDEDEDGVTSLEKWAEIPDYIRENNDVWVIRGHAITIPREREWGFFHRAVDSVVAQYMRGEVPSVGGAAEGIKKEVGQRLPVTGGSLPTVAQLYFGKDIFRGEDIESYWDQKKLPQYRYDDRTSSLARFIGSAADYTGLSPKEADFMIRNTFGSLGPKGTDFLTGLVTGKQGKLSSVPFLGGFMTDMIPRQSQSDYMALRNRSSMEFDEWAKNRGSVPEGAVARILDNEATIGVADHIMKSIRDNDRMDNATKAKYITGLARWALDREPVAEYPNPLLEYYHQDIPVEVRKEILQALKEARSATVRATEDIPKGTEKYREVVKSKRRLGQKLVRPTPKEME